MRCLSPSWDRVRLWRSGIRLAAESLPYKPATLATREDCHGVGVQPGPSDPSTTGSTPAISFPTGKADRQQPFCPDHTNCGASRFVPCPDQRRGAHSKSWGKCNSRTYTHLVGAPCTLRGTRFTLGRPEEQLSAVPPINGPPNCVVRGASKDRSRRRPECSTRSRNDTLRSRG